LEQVVFFVLLTAVSTIYILSSAVILQCLEDFRQEDSQKKQSFSRADNFNTKSSISDPPICDRPDDLDHTYALATEPCNKIDNELFDYIPSDLVPLSHCRFIVDLGFMAEQLKHC